MKGKREREKSARKSLGFHIQLGFKAMSLERISRANDLITKTSRALSLVFGKETQTGEDRGFFCLLFPVFCFLLKLYIRTDRDVLYIEKRIRCCALGKNPRLSLEVCFLFSSCFYQVSLFLCACVHLESERMCCSWYSSRFNLGFRVSLSLSVSVLFLFVNVWSLKDREGEN